MRLTILIVAVLFTLSACNKDKFTTAPQLRFKEFKPNQGNTQSSPLNPPFVIFEITDSEGDLDPDSTKIFIKNTLTNKIDSMLKFPKMGSTAGKNFKADVQISLFSIMAGRDAGPGNPAPFVDTIGFEIYVVDKAKNKSNVILASPFYFFTL